MCEYENLIQNWLGGKIQTYQLQNFAFVAIKRIENVEKRVKWIVRISINLLLKVFAFHLYYMKYVDFKSNIPK